MLKLTPPPPRPSIKFKLSAETTVEELVQACAKVAEIPQGQLQLLHGFPPKPLLLIPSSSTALVADLGIKSGDSVLCADGLPCTLPPTRPLWPLLPLDRDCSLPITRHVIDADNSCLFESILYATDTASGYSSSAALRNAIARLVVLGCDEAMLGKTPQEYADWIVSPEAWGGEIEMSLIVKSLMRGLGLRAVDISTGVVYNYGQGEGEGDVSRVAYLLYDGIHYDLLVRGPQRLFAPDDTEALREAQAVAAEAKRLRAFTDTSSFTLRCLVCQQGLVGQREAQNHAADTGHTNFSEF